MDDERRQHAPADETADERAERYERTLLAIAESPLVGAEFGDWVQSACEDALDGVEPECPECGRPVHPGKCADAEDSDDEDDTVDGGE